VSIASGEWWIDDSGMAQYADGDVGDQNHATMAFDSILAEYDINLDEEPDAPVMDPYNLDAEAKRWLRKHGMPKKAIDEIDGSDPRERMIEHNGWIRLAGTAAQVWKFDDATLKSLRSGIWEAWEGDTWDTLDPAELDIDVLVEETSTRRTFAIPLKALADDRMDAKSLRRLGAAGEVVQAPSTPALRAAWGRKAARERGLEENPRRARPYRRPEWADEFEAVGHQIERDGTIIVYHATTADKAQKILKEGVLRRPASAPDSYGVYFSTSPDVAENYGDGTLVQLRVKVEDLHFDDVFPNGRMDFSARTHGGVYRPVEIKAYPDANPVTEDSMQQAFVSDLRKTIGTRYVVEVNTPYIVFGDGKGHAIGSLVLRFNPPSKVILALVVVQPEYRRRGAGTAMMNLLIQIADKRGWVIAGVVDGWNDTGMSNGKLRTWYRKLGFKIDEKYWMTKEPRP